MKETKKRITLGTVMESLGSFRNEVIHRFDKLEQEHEQYFTAIQTDLLGLRGDVNELKTDVAILKTDVAELKTDVAVLKTDVAQLKTDVSVLQTDMTTVKTDLKEFRSETKSFHSGFGAKTGRQDAFNFLLTGILEGKNILSLEQSNKLRTI